MSGVPTIRSMTGFGSAALDSPALQAEVAIRSVNHRFLDLAVHVPRRLAHLEPEVKALVQGRLSRGRVEVTVRVTLQTASGEGVQVSRDVVAGLLAALRSVKAEHGLEGEVTLSDVARFPGALEVVEGPSSLDEERGRDVLALVERALDGLGEMRRSEGQGLAADLLGCIAALEAAAGRIQGVSEAERPARRDALLEKARSLCGELGLEETRLYQEVVRLVDRHDVAEELQRLRSHAAAARGLVGSGGVCGKRLDFLAQELMREANTIGSKASSSPLVHEVVELKSEVERFREQVQNVE
jgi:uncharacterized protein (TIGR00255 family)